MASALEDLAAGVMSIKADRARKLTPTAAEQAAAPVIVRQETGAPFPYDQLDMFAQAINNIQRDLDFLRTGLGLVAAAAPAPAEDLQKIRERESDRAAAEREAKSKGPLAELAAEIVAEDVARAKRIVEAIEGGDAEGFSERLERLTAEAQAATFKDPVADSTVEGGEDPGDGWVCPEHQKFEAKLSRKGRPFRACPIADCEEFEKLS